MCTGSTWDAVDNAGREYTLERGNEIIELTPEQQQSWKDSVKPVINEYVQGCF